MTPDADGFLVELVHKGGQVETMHPGVVIGAGGAHSITRNSMSQLLEGATYQGHFLGADIAMQAPFPWDQTSVICSQNGLLLLSPLPGGRWISFQDLEEEVQSVTASWRMRPPGMKVPTRRALSSHRRRLVRSVSDASADRLALGGGPAVPYWRRRSSLESIRGRGTQHRAP